MEEWRDISGCEGLYRVSNLGRVCSLDRVIYYPVSGVIRRYKGIMLSPVYDGNMHLQVTLTTREGIPITRHIHTLVLTTFVGPCPEGKEGCHKDGNGFNNPLTNLYWGTRSQNVQDAVNHGTHHRTRKDTCPLNHLLILPNLRRSVLKQGRRGCLACHRAKSNVGTAGVKGIVLDFKETAHQHYWRIMATKETE